MDQTKSLLTENHTNFHKILFEKGINYKLKHEKFLKSFV